MSNFIVEPVMGLIIPTVGIGGDPGPDYANNQNQDLYILASHTHTPGSGVQITPAGLNINSNLSFQNNNATNVYGIAFAGPAPTSTLTFLYTAPQSGGGITDLFYNDGAGNVIALTKAGLVNATIASLPGESYSGGTFTWKQGNGSTTPANFDIGSITIRPNIASTSFGVVLNPPAGISSEYDVQLPIVPSVTGIMQLDASGNMLATLVPDNSTIIISGQMLEINPAYTAAQQAIVSPSGAIVMFGGASAPSGWLLCDGTDVSRTTYSNLFAAISTAYGIGDGTTTFNLPDFRGFFPRGVSGASGNDPDASSRSATNGGNSGNNVGSVQGGQIQSHSHGVTVDVNNDGIGSNHYTQGNSDSAPSFATSLIGTTAAGGNETRPINLYVNFIIKT